MNRIAFIQLYPARATLTLIVTLLLCHTTAAQQPHTITGEVKVHKSFHSKILNNNRDVLVYLPPDYDKSKNRRFSVLY